YPCSLPATARIAARHAAAGTPGSHLERRRRLAGPDLEFRASGCLLRQRRNWSGPGMPGRPSDASAARAPSGRVTPANRSGHADHLSSLPAAFRKLDTVAVLMARLLPAPRHPDGDTEGLPARRAAAGGPLERGPHRRLLAGPAADGRVAEVRAGHG